MIQLKKVYSIPEKKVHIWATRVSFESLCKIKISAPTKEHLGPEILWLLYAKAIKYYSTLQMERILSLRVKPIFQFFSSINVVFKEEQL